MMNFSNNFRENVQLSPFTTLGIGGPARFFVEVKNAIDLKNAVLFAQKNNIQFLVIGSGSNLLVSDKGFEGLVIKNSIRGIKVDGMRVLVQGGTLLQKLVDTANKNGLGGLEKLTDIPGTVAGAIYGNAGAYGQTISDHLVKIKIFDGKTEKWLAEKECGFGYRESMFKKHKNLVILEAELQLIKADCDQLKKMANEIIMIRRIKYRKDIRCPGSFFKNVIASNLPKNVLDKIPPKKIVYGKIPAGYLLEAVGANGKNRDGVRVANHHGNLFVNVGRGTAKAFCDLAKGYQEKVKEKFGITLVPEVQLVGFPKSF